ncbi:flavin reductase family protein [Pseudonocardia parietis]|uniref:Flavin reductase (DIM6/NTAB) family NADH-FMN oxidoreductase RutF n=1 Tax=Pseudonocardia parietis TaxID=570936 RepID=A0ABS4VZ27_9PSEU|nr:flavin reductase family protein [Pseudonocardia parietis]MBP2369138.1 flavin reductase (DIM6/NTAB) family NADH-FMN oxidoreductase RutF [Pseudonocardia parietis]
MSGSPSQSTSVPGPVTPETMRDALGGFASGVVVITAQGPDGPVGFTCQSFSSLSLDPPLVSFSPARTSSTWPRIRELGRFCVNVLAADHEHLSAQFARSGTDKFAGVSWLPAPSGSPVLEGVGAWVDCTLWNEYDGGDHTIVAARVDALGADPERLPLVFFRGGYHLTQRELS